jgi:hypothetical protein
MFLFQEIQIVKIKVVAAVITWNMHFHRGPQNPKFLGTLFSNNEIILVLLPPPPKKFICTCLT